MFLNLSRLGINGSEGITLNADRIEALQRIGIGTEQEKTKVIMASGAVWFIQETEQEVAMQQRRLQLTP